ncbi:MAG: hypothetical protein ABH869_07425 [Candidatus Omnitrophota bacterium]
MEDISYKNGRLKKDAEDVYRLKMSYGKRVSPELIVRRLNQILASRNLQDLQQLYQLNFHALKGKYKGCFAIDVKPRGKYRIIIKPLNGEIKDLKTITEIMVMELCVDYH